MDKKSFNVLSPAIKDGFLRLIEPPVEFIVRLNVHPNFFTILGFILSIVGAYFYATMSIVYGGLFTLFGGICDIIDGKVARKSGLSSKFGALFDSTIDRYSEFAMFFGVGIFFLRSDLQFGELSTAVAFIALGGSMMVSYVRARAEGLGYDCKVGMMQRPERIVYIGISSLVHSMALTIVIYFIAIMANYTVYQRMHHVWASEKLEKNPEAVEASDDTVTNNTSE